MKSDQCADTSRSGHALQVEGFERSGLSPVDDFTTVHLFGAAARLAELSTLAWRLCLDCRARWGLLVTRR